MLVELVDKFEDKDVDADQTRTGRPVKVEEHDIDFRVTGLSHALVREAEHLQVQEVVKKIENHPHRAALQADLQQINDCSPFSNNSKEMQPGMRGTDVAKELTLMLNISKVFTIAFSETKSIANHNSLLAGQSTSA